MKYTIYDKATGIIQAFGNRPDPNDGAPDGTKFIPNLGATLDEGQAMLIGKSYSDATTRIVGGQPVAWTPTPPAITKSNVNNEAHNRITAVYPYWEQLEAIRAGGDPIKDAYKDAVVSASDKLNEMNPIPLDYQDDKWWPTPTDMPITEGTENG